MARQLMTAADAVVTQKQHRSPCSDCPWARTALPGWLAMQSVGWWLVVAHGEGEMQCHTRKTCTNGAHQCAGAATYRANVCKRVDEGNLELPRDTKKVFASPMEFASHHLKREVGSNEVCQMMMDARTDMMRKIADLKPGYVRCEACGLQYKSGMPHAMFCEANQSEETDEELD